MEEDTYKYNLKYLKEVSIIANMTSITISWKTFPAEDDLQLGKEL